MESSNPLEEKASTPAPIQRSNLRNGMRNPPMCPDPDRKFPLPSTIKNHTPSNKNSGWYKRRPSSWLLGRPRNLRRSRRLQPPHDPAPLRHHRQKIQLQRFRSQRRCLQHLDPQRIRQVPAGTTADGVPADSAGRKRRAYHRGAKWRTSQRGE